MEFAQKKKNKICNFFWQTLESADGSELRSVPSRMGSPEITKEHHKIGWNGMNKKKNLGHQSDIDSLHLWQGRVGSVSSK